LAKVQNCLDSFAGKRICNRAGGAAIQKKP